LSTYSQLNSCEFVDPFRFDEKASRQDKQVIVYYPERTN